MKTKICRYCGNELPKSVYTLTKQKCYLCNPYKNGSVKSKAHTKRAMIKHRDKIKILYECRCRDVRKIRHHFDYKRMFDVFLLCTKCHMAEHNRIEPGFNSPNKYGSLTGLFRARKILSG